jgi:BirA family biotin operon repressor/biotin-[acetyl-CoA-carboxylase] ligase
MDRKLDELLFALMQNMTIAVSGEKLARELEVSHSTLTRWVEKLREAGVEILGELFTGYRLTRLPDVMLPQLIRPRLHTQTIGKSIFHFFSVDSTNAFASRLLLHGRKLAHGSIVIAESQSAGRGRLGRVWYSESGSGLYFSIVLRPKIPPGYAPLFTLGTAVALHDAIEKITGLQVDIKWPNDLLVDGKKVSGILAEMQSEFDRVNSLIIGVGVNVNHSAVPRDLENTASSLRMISGKEYSRLEILVEFLEEFENLLTRFELSGPVPVIDAWSERSSFANGRRLQIHNGFRVVSGITEGLNQYGALRLRTVDGGIEEIYSGEISLEGRPL